MLRSLFRQENFLRYVTLTCGIDKICDYIASIETNTKLIRNPARDQANAAVRDAEKTLAAAERELAGCSPTRPSSPPPRTPASTPFMNKPPGPEASQSPLYLMGRVALVVAAWRPTWSPNGPATPSRRGPTVRFSGRTYPKLAWLLRALCAVVGCCCLPLVAGVAVIVAVRLDHESRWPGVTRLCAWCQNPIPAKARRDAVCCSVRCRQARHRFLRAVGRADSVATGRPLRLAWSLRVAPPPIGLTAADLFAGGKVSRADSRVR